MCIKYHHLRQAPKKPCQIKDLPYRASPWMVDCGGAVDQKVLFLKERKGWLTTLFGWQIVLLDRSEDSGEGAPNF